MEKEFLYYYRYAKPISVARRVLDHPSLSMLVGNGATQFALEQGFSLEENSKLLTQETKQAYEVIIVNELIMSWLLLWRKEGNLILDISGQIKVY